jgi:hypothetical protein
VITFLLSTTLHLSVAVPQEPVEPPALQEELAPVRVKLRTLAESLAKASLLEELALVEEELVALGATEKEIAALLKKTDKARANPKPPRDERATLTLKRRLSTKAVAAARSLTALALEEGRTPGHQRVLAASALHLDGNSNVAHQLLGHALGTDGRWRSEKEMQQQQWLRDFAQVTQQARSLNYDLQDIESTDPVLQALAPDSTHALAYRGLQYEGSIGREALSDKLTLALRGGAISNWILNGALEPVPADLTVVWTHFGPAYQDYLDRCAEDGLLQEKIPGLAADMSGTWTAHQHRNSAARTYYLSSTVEPIVETFFKGDRAFSGDPAFYDWFEMFYSRSATAPAWLVAGHVNLIGLGFYGVGWGKYLSIANDPSKTTVRTRGFDPKLAGAGIVGCRSYIRALAIDERDPPLETCLKGEVGLLRGDILLKATMVVEYLYARDGARAVLDRYRAAFEREGGEHSPLALLEATLGQPLPEFESEWRAWILGGTATVSLTGMLTPADPRDQAPEDPVSRRLLEDLNRRRQVAELAPVYLDEELSEGCALHASYLKRHTERAASWPEVHEQTMDHPDFSTAGSWAAGHSVIAFGGTSRCLDDWLGSFYHRLPLLEPMLLGVGFGVDGQVCVLDAGSLVNRTGGWANVYPYHGMKNVPRRFAPELPNPVPGQSQHGWGYPITLQLGASLGEPPTSLTMTGPKGVVDCWFTSPNQPLNPQLVPPGASCLIPKQALAANTTYSVEAVFGNERMNWSFTTGR